MLILFDMVNFSFSPLLDAIGSQVWCFWSAPCGAVPSSQTLRNGSLLELLPCLWVSPSPPSIKGRGCELALCLMYRCLHVSALQLGLSVFYIFSSIVSSAVIAALVCVAKVSVLFLCLRR